MTVPKHAYGSSPCKNICTRYKARKPPAEEGGRYSNGQKRCQICEIFVNYEGLWCPCCGYRLRTKPRNLKYKTKLKARAHLTPPKHMERIEL